jgi:hypothetical protein
MNKVSHRKVGLAALVLALLLAFAVFERDRIVDWQGEVLLNTRETITVFRSTTYSNAITSFSFPFFHFVPTFESTISFEHLGKKYQYKGIASLMTVAIALPGVPF